MTLKKHMHKKTLQMSTVIMDVTNFMPSFKLYKIQFKMADYLRI